MEKNINQEINRLNIEKSKQIAESLKDWEGVGARKSPVASSFLNGSTGQMLKESQDMALSPKIKDKTTFSFGVLNTVSALKNTSFNDLPAGKMMLEKYSYLIIEKGISEAFLIEGLVNDLKSFSWEDSVSMVAENLNHIFENRRREVEVVKTYEAIKNSPGKDLFSDAINQMKNWLVSEKKATDSLIHDIKRFGFNPMVRNLVSFLSIYENQNSGKFNVGFDNDVCEVKNLYSPIHVNENGSIFFASGKFFKIDESSNTLSECSMDEVPSDLINKAGILTDKDIKIEKNKIVLSMGKNKVEIVFENEEKKILFNGKKINESELASAVSIVTNNLLENSNVNVSKAVFIANLAEEIIDLDFGKKITSKVYENVEANIFKIGNKIYVQTVNPAMNLNKVYEANATQSINIVKDFIKYDITESLTEFLQGEEAILSIMKNDKKEIAKNIEILENEIRKVEAAKIENPLIVDSTELKELQEGIENEIEILKDKWNQINTEITRFEKSAKEIDSDVNEAMGYPIDTEIRVKRNGVKGKVIGVDNNSKTYTILFSEGKTGEYFFSDVEDLGDEVEQYDIQGNEVNLEMTEEVNVDNSNIDDTNESVDQQLAEAPEETGKSRYDKVFMDSYKKYMSHAPEEKGTKPSSKFIEDQENANLSDAPDSKGKSPLTKEKTGSQGLASLPKGTAAKSKNFIEDTKNAELAKAPEGNIKGSAEFIEDLKNHKLSLKESQKNSHIEKAPKGKLENPKKFMEDEENADLAEAPGDHKKNGKKFVEDLKNADLSEAPKTKKK